MKTLILTALSAALLTLSGAATADQALAQKNACMSCHSIKKEDKGAHVGPYFINVAKKYAGDKDAPARLAAKVRAGGKGVWVKELGAEIPMPPNPQVNDADLKKIVAWVLSLK